MKSGNERIQGFLKIPHFGDFKDWPLDPFTMDRQHCSSMTMSSESGQTGTKHPSVPRTLCEEIKLCRCTSGFPGLSSARLRSSTCSDCCWIGRPGSQAGPEHSGYPGSRVWRGGAPG